MTEPQIIQTLKDRQDSPGVNAIISEFHCGYQMARRIWKEARRGEDIYCAECGKLIADLPLLCRGVILCEPCTHIYHPEHPGFAPKAETEIDLFD